MGLVHELLKFLLVRQTGGDLKVDGNGKALCSLGRANRNLPRYGGPWSASHVCVCVREKGHQKTGSSAAQICIDSRAGGQLLLDVPDHKLEGRKEAARVGQGKKFFGVVTDAIASKLLEHAERDGVARDGMSIVKLGDRVDN